MYFHPNEKVQISNRQLPHWRQKEVTYFITFRLHDSLPQKTLLEWKLEKENFLKTHTQPLGPKEEKEFQERFTNKLDKWLDKGFGSCILGNKSVSNQVAQSIMHFDKIRYYLGEWVIMPNHVHVIVAPKTGFSLSKILHSWKSYSANQINKSHNREGPLWQEESFDQIIRNELHFYRAHKYIKRNPQKAGISVHHASWINQNKSSKGVHRLEACAT